LIKVEDLDIKLKDFILHGITLEVRDGEYYVLLGPSGAGKTVILETVAGLLKQRKGTIIIGGKDVSSAPPESRHIAFVPQDLALFPHLSVLENILFGAKARGMSPHTYQSRFDDLVGILQLGHRLSAFPRTLSGGEKQRVALARALITTPEIILLDEPMSSLDPPIRRQLQRLLKEIHTHFAVTILHVTHDQEEAFILGDVISILMDSKIVQTGKRNRVYFFPETKDIALFTGMENVFRGAVLDTDSSENLARLSHSGVTFTARYDKLIPRQEVFFGVRAEEVMIIKEGRPLPRSVEDENVLPVILQRVIEKGSSHTMEFLETRGLFPVIAEVPNYVYRKLSCRIGQEMKVFIRKRNICIMET
jgi:ABC-type sugar transport system ATPase subunit